MLTGPSYDPNRFRADLPGGIQKVSPDLYAFLRETLQGLRQFNSDALHGALRLNQQVLATRYINLVHPLDSRAAVQLSTGQTAFARFRRLAGEPNPDNEGRLLYRGIDGNLVTEGEDVEFAGVDYTRTGAGEYGWVVYGSYAPLHDGIFAGDSPAVVGVAGSQFTHLASLKWGTVDGGMIYLMPAFGVPGEVGGSSLAELLSRLAESEADIQTLKDSVQSITKAFGRFQSASVLALSRIENRTPDEFMQSVYSEFLEQTANVVAIGRQISVDRSYIDAQTGIIRGFATVSQQHSITSKSFAIDSKYWAEATQETNLSAQAHSAAAQTWSGISQTYSVSAGEFAAKAEIALAAMATIGAPSLAENVGFDSWSDPGADPDAWVTYDGSGTTFTRIAGPNTPYAIQIDVAAGVVSDTSLVYQTVASQTNDLLGTATPGWYVVEFNVELTAGSFADKTILLRLKTGSTFVHDEDIPLADLSSGGIAIGAGTVGRFYRANLLIDLTGYSFNTIELHLRPSIAGTTAVATTMAVDLFSVRFATQAEVATQTILTSVVDQVASMQTSVNLLVDEYASQALAITNLGSQYNGLDDRLDITEGSVATLTTAVAGHTSQLTALTTASTSYASRLDTVEASFTAIDLAVDGLGTTVAGHTTTLTSHSSTLTTHAGLLSSQGSAIDTLTSSYNATIPGLVSTVASHESEITTLATAQGSQATQITTLTSNYGTLAGTVTSQGTAISGINSTLTDHDTRLTGMEGTSATHTTQITTLTTTSTAQATAITNLTSRVGNSEAAITSTQSTLDGVLAKYTLRLDVNGDVVGFELINGTNQRTFNIRADSFFIRTSTGLKQLFAATEDKIEFGTDLHVQNNRIIYDNGLVMRVQGTGFGSANQFVDWFGPKMPISSCNESNGEFWLKTNTEAYFGGSLSAGLLTNKGATSDLNPTASVDVGPFGSNGGAVVVVLSASGNFTFSGFYDPSPEGRDNWDLAVAAWGATTGPHPDGGIGVAASKQVACTIRVELLKNATVVQTLAIDSYESVIEGKRPDFVDTGYLAIQDSFVGTLTWTDNSGTTTSRTLTAQMTQRTNFPFPQVQRISIIANEQ